MRLPKKVVLFGKIELPIKYFDNAKNVDCDRKRTLTGMWDSEESEVRVYRGARSEGAIMQSIYHEALHAICELCGIELPKEGEECIVDALATAIYSMEFK